MDKVEVTEADKDKSVELAHSLGLTAEEFTSGAADILVQAFARHRITTEAATRAKDADRVIACLGGCRDGMSADAIRDFQALAANLRTQGTYK